MASLSAFPLRIPIRPSPTPASGRSVQNAVGGSGATIESAGTIYDRCRRFVTVKLGTDLDTFKGWEP